MEFCTTWNNFHFEYSWLSDEGNIQLCWSELRFCTSKWKIHGKAFSVFSKVMPWSAISIPGFYLKTVENDTINNKAFCENFGQFTSDLEQLDTQTGWSNTSYFQRNRNFLVETSVQILQWPANSPYINSVKHESKMLKWLVLKENPTNK